MAKETKGKPTTRKPTLEEVFFTASDSVPRCTSSFKLQMLPAEFMFVFMSSRPDIR